MEKPACTSRHRSASLSNTSVLILAFKARSKLFWNKSQCGLLCSDRLLNWYSSSLAQPDPSPHFVHAVPVLQKSLAGPITIERYFFEPITIILDKAVARLLFHIVWIESDQVGNRFWAVKLMTRLIPKTHIWSD